MQSHQGYIHILPALPSSWPEGDIKGLRSRNGFEVDMSWKNRKLVSLKIKSISGKKLRLKYGDKLIEKETQTGENYQIKEL